MLGLAKFKRARFLLASTSEVYGDPQVHPQPEHYWGHVNPIGPRGVYDEAKRYAEALTMAYHRQQGVNTCIARVFNTFGARMRPHDGRAIPTFLRQALQDKPVTVFGEGSQTRSFCYVDDLIRGFVLLAESDVHLPVNLGNPKEMTLLELAEAVIEVDRLALGDRLRGAAGRRSHRYASRTSRGRSSCSAGSRRSSSATASSGRSSRPASSGSSAPRIERRPGESGSPPCGISNPAYRPPAVQVLSNVTQTPVAHRGDRHEVQVRVQVWNARHRPVGPLITEDLGHPRH